MPFPTLPATAADFTPAQPNVRTTLADVFPAPPPPKTPLAEYKVLSPLCGLRVSPLILGGMSLGTQWRGYLGGKLEVDEAEKLLDFYYESGGNMIDVANMYQDGQAEMIIGGWMASRKNRDEMIIATKYTTLLQYGERVGITINAAGNHRKNMFKSVEESLKRLQTSYVDILYLHWWDWTTGHKEIMIALNDLVRSGKVHYLGVSDVPAWVVAQANDFAHEKGLSPFVIYTGHWNLAARDLEREVLPMSRSLGLAISPWGALGSGKFRPAEELQRIAEEGNLRGGQPPTEAEIKVSKVLEEISHELGGVALASIAMAWTRQKYWYTFPVVGGQKLHQLQANIDALKIRLSDEQMERLDNAVPFDWGFPYNTFGRDPRGLPEGKSECMFLNSAGPVQVAPGP